LDQGVDVYFKRAHEFAVQFYENEIHDIASVEFQSVSLEKFFNEYIWVVHATGFSAKQVGKMISRLIVAYGDPINFARKPEQEAIEPILKICNNPQKAKAVRKTAEILSDGISKYGWERYRNHFLCDPSKLDDLPYIGKVTCYHLARNIGQLDFIKPDLHLVRMAKHWGFGDDPYIMCEAVQPEGMPLGIVDLIFWYAASTFGTLEIRGEGDR
jgi:endonuclease III